MKNPDFATALLEFTHGSEGVVGRVQFNLPHPVSLDLAEACRGFAGVEDAFAVGHTLTLTAQACPDEELAKAVLTEAVYYLKEATGYNITMVGVQRVNGQALLGPASIPGVPAQTRSPLLGRFCRSGGLFYGY